MSTWEWLSWLLRVPLVAAIAVRAVGSSGKGARAAALGLGLTLLPRVVRALGGPRTPPIAELPYVLAVSLEAVSKTFNLAARIRPWDKFVHFMEIGLFSWLVTVLLSGYRDAFNPGLPTGLLRTTAVLSGISLGALWEVVEYAIDRFVKQNLLKSARGTVLDLLIDSLGALTGTLLAGKVYDRSASRPEREQLGAEASRLTGQPSDPAPGQD